MLTDKVVVITGSTRGIGRAIAESCATAGARVVVSSRTEQQVRGTCIDFKRKNLNATGITADVTQEGDIQRLKQHAIDTWGHIDIWINNAGLSGGYRFIQDLSLEEINQIIDVNLKGVMFSCKLTIPYFIARNSGIILNISGRGGKSEAAPYLSVYAATKAAVSNLSKSLAQENKSHPISIHSVIPGMVETDFYRDIATSPGLEKEIAQMPYILRAFGIPVEAVGKTVAEIASQKPGKSTGKIYNLLTGGRLISAISKVLWFRICGKIK